MITLLAMFLLSQTGEAWHGRGGCVDVQPVKASDKVPCTGILWPAGFTADALETMKVTLPECRVKLDSAKRELKICDETVINVRKECDATINRFAALTKEAARIERPWWDNNTLWGGAGFVFGTVITVLIVNAAGDPF